jgi:hypothetical protein
MTSPQRKQGHLLSVKNSKTPLLARRAGEHASRNRAILIRTPAMSPPLAYHLTWTAYGTWLPGDNRGWVDGDQPGIRPADPDVHRRSQHRLADDPVEFDDAQRQLIEQTLQDHARIRGWTMHAQNVRSNHVHLIVTGDAPPRPC